MSFGKELLLLAIELVDAHSINMTRGRKEEENGIKKYIQNEKKR